jgi:hypothetical protein
VALLDAAATGRAFPAPVAGVPRVVPLDLVTRAREVSFSRKTTEIESFPYNCPEPVLANRRVSRRENGAKTGVSIQFVAPRLALPGVTPLMLI